MDVAAITDCNGVISWKWFNVSDQSKIHTNTFTTQYSKILSILSILLDVILNILDDDVRLKISILLLMLYGYITIKSCKNGYCAIGNSELIGSGTLPNSKNKANTL